MNNDDYLKELAYEPYIKEMQYNVPRFLILFAVITIIFLFLYYKLAYIILLILIVLVCGCIRLSAYSIIEKRKNYYETKKVTMIRIAQESNLFSFYREYIIDVFSKVYPEKLHISRYKITCFTEEGNKIKLRCAINATNSQILYDNIEKPGGWTRTVTYGKYSKIIVDYNDKDYEALVLRRRYNSYNPDKQEKNINNKKIRRNNKKKLAAISYIVNTNIQV